LHIEIIIIIVIIRNSQTNLVEFYH
jgi:hypothetical protein